MASVYRTEDCQFTVDREALIRRLGEGLPADSLLVDDEAMRPYECDGLSGYRQMPQVVTIPETVDQVRHVVAVCSEMAVPIVARGAGTSLSAGALPHPQGVLLSLAKFNRILEIDHERRIARLQPGVRNLAISEAAAPYEFFFVERYAEAFRAQLDAFFDSIETGAAVQAGFEDGHCALLLAEAAYRSLREGRMVRVEEVTQ